MAAKRKYYNLIKVIHEEWCAENGYPTGRKPFFNSGKLQATSAKLHPNDLLDSENATRFVESAKPQATSVKLQAASDKLQASKGRSSNKR